jgi:hypothetical protein
MKIYKVNDKAEKHYLKHELFDVPFRLLIVGKSQLSGKSNFIVNLMLRPDMYGKVFEGEDIYIVSASIDVDKKLQIFIEMKDIPPQNLFHKYNEEELMILYQQIEEEYKKAVSEEKAPKNKIIIFDDISFNGDLKKKQHGVINKIFSNGRHINLSTIVTAQKYSDILTAARENASASVFFNCSSKQLELIEMDHNYTNSKKQFFKMFRDSMQEKHDFFVVNYSNPKEQMYLNSSFEPIPYSMK